MPIANNRRTELLAKIETHRLLQAEAEETLRAIDGTMAREDNLPAPRVNTQKQVADESRQSENFRMQSGWDKTFDSMPDLIMLLDREFRITRVNRAQADRLRVTPAELIGERCCYVIHGGEYPPDFCLNHMVNRDGQEHFTETFLPALNGHFLASVTPFYDDDGKFTGSVHVLRDITERKQAEVALKNSEERYRQLFEMECDALLMFDWESGRIIDANSAATRMYGHLKNEIKLLKAVDLSVDPAVTEKSMRGCEAVAPLCWHLKKDGTEFPVEITYSYFDYLGIRVCAAAIRDISERIQAESALRESEELNRMTLNALPAQIAVIDSQGVIIAVNSAWLESAINNEARVQLVAVGVNYLEVCRRGVAYNDDQNARQALTGIEAVLSKAQERFAMEYCCNSPLQENWFSMTVVPFGVNGTTCAVVSHFDITERKQAELELINYSRRLIEVEEDFRRKIAEELHDDICGNLTALGINMSFIDGTLNECVPQELLARMADTKKIIDDVRVSTRNIMGSLRPSELDDLDLIAALNNYIAGYSTRYGIAVSFETDEAFPRIASDKELILFRIVQEALTNIVKHAEAQVVNISLSQNSGKIRLAVSDNGSGFVSCPTRGGPAGHGMGVRTMKKRAEILGGSFSLESLSGSGTTVTVQFGEAGNAIETRHHILAPMHSSG